MKTLITISLLIFAACNSATNSGTSQNAPNTLEGDERVDTVREFAKFLLAGNSTTLETFQLKKRIFDSILSPIDTTRTYYLSTSILLLKKGDAVIDSDFGSNLILLLKERPREFIETFVKQDAQVARDIGLTIGTFIVNHSKNKAKNAEMVAELLLKNINQSSVTEATWAKTMIQEMRHAVETLSH